VSDVIDATGVASFREQGWLLTRVTDASVTELQEWVDEVAAWPDASGKWLQYRELTDDGPKLCRSENFVPFHRGLRSLLTTGAVAATASALLDEPAVLYKEKINYKAAGGAGYAAHQDAPAYPFVRSHVSCMIAVDDAALENGCLEVATAAHGEILAMDERGCIRQDVVDALQFAPVELRAGEALWFHSRTPHRSGPNRSSAPRRAIFPTYNAASEGDQRETYYAEKLRTFASTDTEGDRVRVSLIGDFQGRAAD